MDLTIEKNSNVYELKGSLVRFNVHLFQNEFQNIFEEKNELTISIMDWEKSDNFGINVIAKLHNEAISKNKKLAIIGFGNNQLVDHFKTNKVAWYSSFCCSALIDIIFSTKILMSIGKTIILYKTSVCDHNFIKKTNKDIPSTLLMSLNAI